MGTFRDGIGRFRDWSCRTWTPSIFLIAVTIGALLFIYRTPAPLIGVVLAVLAVAAYLLYVGACRTDKFSMTAASVAFAIGPMIATMYVHVKNKQLYAELHDKGDVLIQLSSFFTGCIVLIGAFLSTHFSKDADDLLKKIDQLLIFLMFVGMFIWMLFFGGDLTTIETPTIELFAGIYAPPLTSLTVFRMVFLIISIYFATRPRTHRKQQVAG
ncbi:MAG TPA: hypothetical protein VNA69_17120 [Thermoanaerobaculia bacterium]|nr:hypothetical protein [Thermoanaerobaculia bacterium]